MRLVLDKILWGTLLILFGPTVMIVASWNALPGDNLYGVKLSLEKAALALASPSYATSGNLQIKYTERRFAEARQLMASKQSIQGLPYLDQQIAQTKKAIENAPNKEAQVTLAKQYIATLSTVSTDLETQKQSITMTSPQSPQIPQSPQSSPTNPSTPTPTSDVKEVPTPEVKKPTPSPTNTPTPVQMAQVTATAPIPTQHAVVALQIDQTQRNVTQTIADLQALVGEDGRDKDDHRENKQKKNEEEREDMEKDEKRNRK